MHLNVFTVLLRCLLERREVDMLKCLKERSFSLTLLSVANKFDIVV